MNEISYEIKNDVLMKYTLINEDIYREEVVIDKDTFIKCFEEWVESEEEE